MTRTLVDLTVEDINWEQALPDLEAVCGVGAALAVHAVDLISVENTISILACSDARIQELNTDFRDKAAPTNVLSWPAYELTPSAPGKMPPAPPESPFDGPNLLGDVAIALQTCVHEAEIAGIPLKNHVTHLILHGCLHLLGFDHQTEEDAATMEGIETRALARVQISDPYA